MYYYKYIYIYIDIYLFNFLEKNIIFPLKFLSPFIFSLYLCTQ